MCPVPDFFQGKVFLTMLVTEKSNFNRGDKASVSVRLRSKKSEVNNVKKRNRHSGDFSFFKHQNNTQSPAPHSEETEVDGRKDGGDWAYITFQNGVPTVQDIKTNVGPVSAREPVGVVINGSGPPMPRPVKVVSHAMPWQQPPLQNKRMSGDFSMYAPPHYQQATPMSRQATPAAVAMRQRSPQKTPSPQSNVTKVQVQPQSRPNVMYRRRSEQTTQNGGVALHAGVSKRCSGEFDFNGRGQYRKSSSDYSLCLQDLAMPLEEEAPPSSVVRVQVNYNKNSRPKSMIFSGSPDIVKGTPVKKPVETNGGGATSAQLRPPGLGRRAVTQINIKRNSYSSAICKSQENLVKVRGPQSFATKNFSQCVHSKIFGNFLSRYNLSLELGAFFVAKSKGLVCKNFD